MPPVSRSSASVAIVVAGLAAWLFPLKDGEDQVQGNIYLYILVMAVVTYLVRMLPLTLIRREIKNVYIRSFLYYIPYATLAAMAFSLLFFMLLPASGPLLAGFAVALILAYKGKGPLGDGSYLCLCRRFFGRADPWHLMGTHDPFSSNYFSP